MKMWKRTLTSIFRKPAQSILMFLIIFLLGNVLFASIAIKQTSENVRLEMRARVPSYMTIRATTDNQSKTTKEKIEIMIDLVGESVYTRPAFTSHPLWDARSQVASVAQW